MTAVKEMLDAVYKTVLESPVKMRQFLIYKHAVEIPHDEMFAIYKKHGVWMNAPLEKSAFREFVYGLMFDGIEFYVNDNSELDIELCDFETSYTKRVLRIHCYVNGTIKDVPYEQLDVDVFRHHDVHVNDDYDLEYNLDKIKDMTIQEFASMVLGDIDGQIDW